VGKQSYIIITPTLQLSDWPPPEYLLRHSNSPTHSVDRDTRVHATEFSHLELTTRVDTT